jgi:hypothetical protein
MITISMRDVCGNVIVMVSFELRTELFKVELFWGSLILMARNSFPSEMASRKLSFERKLMFGVLKIFSISEI